MPGGILPGSADINKIDAFGTAAGRQFVQPGDVQKADAILGGAPVGVGFGGGAPRIGHGRQPVPVGARLQFVAGQRPAGSAVFQPHHFPRQPHPLQNPRPDDAAGAPGAVDHHRSVRIQPGGDVGNAKRQLAAGHTAPAGDAKTAVLLRRARIQNDHLVAPFHPGMQLNGVNFRHLMHDFHLFAKVLARHIDAPFGGVIQAHPAVDAAVQPGNVAVAHSGGGSNGARRPAAVIIAKDGEGIGMRHGGRQVKLQHPARDEAAAGDMAGVILARLAHINEGKRRRALAQQFVQAGRGNRLGHSGHLRGQDGGQPQPGRGTRRPGPPPAIVGCPQLCRPDRRDATGSSRTAAFPEHSGRRRPPGRPHPPGNRRMPAPAYARGWLRWYSSRT